jgi:hypothetical protein
MNYLSTKGLQRSTLPRARRFFQPGSTFVMEIAQLVMRAPPVMEKKVSANRSGWPAPIYEVCKLCIMLDLIKWFF